jgi:GDP-L-fucose synthase
MYIAKEENKDMIIWGTGKPLREFIFSKDVANLTSLLYENYKGTDPVILSSSEEISIKELVDIMAEIFNFKGNIKFDSSKPDGQFRKPSDNTVIKDLYPDYTFTNIYDGLSESIEWFVQNYETARK